MNKGFRKMRYCTQYSTIPGFIFAGSRTEIFTDPEAVIADYNDESVVENTSLFQLFEEVHKYVLLAA